MKNKFIIISLAVLFCFSCQEDHTPDQEEQLFSEMNNDDLGIDFINKIENTKSFNIFNYRNFYNGGGVGIADINNDGLSDIFLTSNMGKNKLYLNKGDWKFEDISESAGIEEAGKWSTGVVMLDINGDKLTDIYVCNAGYKEGSDQKNALFINQGDLSFVNQAEEFGLDDNGYTTHAAFADFDLDGDLDVYMLNNSFIPVNTLNYSNKRQLRAKDWPVKDFLKGGGDKYYQNNNGKFKDVSEESGIYGSLIGFGLGVTVGDINGDSWPDIYVSNDFFERDYLYINNGNGGFTEELEDRINHLSHSSMGADMADINNDGNPEIFVTDMLPDDEYRLKTTTTFDNINLRNLKQKQGFYNQFMHNTLQLNDGDGKFHEISYYADVAASDWSWGALMFDADNDRYADIFVCNGIYHDVINQDFIDFFANQIIAEMALTGKKEEIDSIINEMPSVPIPNKLFMNSQNLEFRERAKELGLGKSSFSNGSAYGDLDNDGDLDLVVNNVNQAVTLYKNNSDKASISFRLEFEENNPQAIGSKVEVYSGEEVLSRELIPSRGFQSSIDHTIVIGLGDDESIDSILITWPNRKITKLNLFEPNKINKVKYEPGKAKLNEPEIKKTKALLTRLDHNFMTHSEDNHIDFYYERNIPVRLSKEGPACDMADINQDGYDDLVVGGAANQVTQVYMGSKNGFEEADTVSFEKFKAFEDTFVKFFDADNDGDQDLLIASGGNNPTYIARAFRDRIYMNVDGKFELNFNALPKNAFNTSVILPHDFDSDGDLDLFVGSRSIPGQYGLSPGSFIYMNNGKGQFYDATQELVPELSFAGMVTDAVWADILPNDGKELVIVGEWMAPKILSFNGARFDIIESKLSGYAGWWQSIEASDMNGDGIADLVIGNLGDNFYLEADAENPLLLWINDFDQNESIEKVISRRVGGKDVPVAMKRDITDQINSLKKQNLKHEDYASKSIQELFTREQLEKVTLKQINYSRSIIAFNNEDGDFIISKMNKEAQFSCINDIICDDVNLDGLTDVIIAGNNHGFLPQFSQLDACRGKVLMNKGNGIFDVLSNRESGLELSGVVNQLKLFSLGDRKYFLAMKNDNSPELYLFNK
ncbi:MAG: VCBS repeat-containing protein [Bacteroidia bacterium]|nr:VCBS repeat-containing protein [Bacteroidia bacterium]